MIAGARIVLGWSLDSAPAAVGLPPLHATVGPMGYLDLLGQWLGLVRSQQNEATRIAYCLRALRRDPSGFWQASLEADPWATARRVLSMHDALRLAGWDGTPGGLPPRLADLARLGLPQTGLADGLHAAIAALEAGPRRELAPVDLLEPAALWPGAWQALFAALGRHGVEVRENPLPAPAAPGDLGALQRFLIDGTLASSWQGDASLTLLAGQNETAQANVISAWLSVSGEDTAVIGAGGGMLSVLLRARHQPRLAKVRGGDLGGQILALGLALLWEPFDATAAIEFLALPHHPLGRACRFLTDAILESPGHGGPAYRAARLWAIRDQLKRDQMEGHDRAQRHHRARDRLAAIDAWLPSQRFGASEGMPAEGVIALCSRVTTWAQSREMPEAAVSAAMLAEAVGASGEARLSPMLLGRIMESLAGHEIEVLAEQAAPWRYFAEPGARIDSVATAVWWLPAEAGGLGSPWRRVESDWMTQRGLLPDDRVCRARERHGMMRAVLATTQRLIIVRPPANTETNSSPAMLASLAACYGSAADAAWIAAETLQAGGSLASNDLPVATLQTRNPPGAQRHWRMPPGRIAPRRRESASGLELLLGCPLAWTLKYGARLRSTGIAALPDTDRLIGLLAHDIMRRVFAEGVPSPALAGSRAQKLFDSLLPEQGAPLLQPGMEAIRERARIGLAQAMNTLAQYMQAGRLSVVGVEQELERDLPKVGGVFTGRVDLLLSRKDGLFVVLDAKWSRSRSWHRKKLESGTAIQLAAYAWLVELHGPATAGYFLLRQARLYAADCEAFPEMAAGGPPLTQTWENALSDYQEALSRLASGEVIAAGIPDDEPGDDDPEPLLPIEAPCNFCDYQTLCGKGASA